MTLSIGQIKYLAELRILHNFYKYELGVRFAACAFMQRQIWTNAPQSLTAQIQRGHALGAYYGYKTEYKVKNHNMVFRSCDQQWFEVYLGEPPCLSTI